MKRVDRAMIATVITVAMVALAASGLATMLNAADTLDGLEALVGMAQVMPAVFGRFSRAEVKPPLRQFRWHSPSRLLSDSMTVVGITPRGIFWQPSANDAHSCRSSHARWQDGQQLRLRELVFAKCCAIPWHGGLSYIQSHFRESHQTHFGHS